MFYSRFYLTIKSTVVIISTFLFKITTNTEFTHTVCFYVPHSSKIKSRLSVSNWEIPLCNGVVVSSVRGIHWIVTASVQSNVQGMDNRYSDWIMNWITVGSCFDARNGQGNFFVFKQSDLALGATQLPI